MDEPAKTFFMVAQLSRRPGEPLGESPDSGAPPSGGAGSPTDSPAAGRRGLLAWPYSKALMTAALLTHAVALVMISGFGIGNIIFALPIAAPAFILCALAITKGKPGFYLGAAITLLLFPLLFLAFVPQYLAVPQFGPLFAGAVLAVLSVFFGLPAGLWVWRHRGEDLPALSLRDGVRTRHGVLTVLVAGLFLGAAAAGQAAWLNALSSTPVGADFEATVQVTISAEAYFFHPNEASFPAGQVVEITLVNNDPDYHTFTYAVGEKTYSHDMLPSTTSKVLLVITDAGDYRFWCIPHEFMGMEGVLHVT